MLLVIPSIEIKKGKCTYCIQGEKGSESFYNNLAEHPEELCRLLRKENSKSIHITDVDSLFHGTKDNFDKIIQFSKAVDIPIQVKAKFDDIEDCEFFLDNGIYRVIICDLGFSKPNDVRDLIKKYLPSRVAFCLHAHNGKIHIDKTDQTMTDREYIHYAKGLGADRIMYHDTKWETIGSPPDFHDLKRLTKDLSIKITLANGISSVQQLWELNRIVTEARFSLNTVDSVIIGKPLYENLFPCQKIWRLAESRLEKTK